MSEHDDLCEVRSVKDRAGDVNLLRTAEETAGGWGATVVVLKNQGAA